MFHRAQAFWLGELREARSFNCWIADLIAPSIRGDVLEIGCGIANFTGLIARQASSVVAVDLDPEYITTARQRWKDHRRVSFRCCDATTEAWKSEFDTIVLLDVLEHVEDDIDFLRSLRRALRPDGTLVVKVPSGDCLYGTMDGAIGHYRRYSKKTLRSSLHSAGWRDLDNFYFNRLGVLGWWLNGRVLQRVTPPATQVTAIEMLVSILRRMERLAPLPFGLSLISIAS